jgi:hypothetical protein
VRKYLKWAFIAVALAIPLGIAGFFVGMRQAPLTPAQMLALKRLAQPTPSLRPDKDASDLVWVLDRDVPEDRRHEVAGKIREYESRRGKPGVALRDPRLEWPRFSTPPRGAGTCDDSKPGCLAYVSEQRSLVAATLDANSGALELQRQLADFDGYRRGFEENLHAGLPNLGEFRRLLTTSFALQFASGEPLSAVEGVCHDLAGWRRVGGNSDDLVVSMIGVAWVRQDLMLLADMLAKLPKDTALPDQCNDALAASKDYEFDLCPAFRSEFGLYRQMRAIYAASDDKPLPPWMVDWRRTEARIAEDVGRFCDPAIIQRQRADKPVSLPPAAVCTDWQRRADPVGCVLSQSVQNDLRAQSLDRRTDQSQMLALMRAVVWLRASVTSKEEVAEALTRVPTDIGLLRAPEYDLENDRISIALHETSRQARFEIAAGAEPRPTGRRRRFCCSRPRASRNLAMRD